MSGYTECACRDCMETTVSSDVAKPAFCDECLTHACDVRASLGKTECNVPGAYDGDGYAVELDDAWAAATGKVGV